MTLCFFDVDYGKQIRGIEICTLLYKLCPRRINYLYSFDCLKDTIKYCKEHKMHSNVIIVHFYNQNTQNNISEKSLYNSRLQIVSDGIAYYINPAQFHVIKRLELKNV